VLAIVAALVLGGCGFQPLYGPTASGAQLTDVMRSVEIAPVPGRVGQRVRNELLFRTTGGAEPATPQYRLEIAIRESLQNTLVTRTGDPQGRVFQLYAEYRLIRLADSQVVFAGHSNARAAFDKVDSVFADIRAERDAENRAARTMADAIRTRLATYLSGNA
jgi:LPS-assembly lipoprotein